MFKKYVENKIYEHIETVEVNDKYHIENYVDRTSADYVVMRKHKQGFKLKILFFKKIVWITSKIEIMAIPSSVMCELLNFEDSKVETMGASFVIGAPMVKELESALFQYLGTDTRFTFRDAFYGKQFDNGDFKVLSINHLMLQEPKITDVNSIIISPKVMARFYEMNRDRDFYDTIKEEKINEYKKDI